MILTRRSHALVTLLQFYCSDINDSLYENYETFRHRPRPRRHLEMKISLHEGTTTTPTTLFKKNRIETSRTNKKTKPMSNFCALRNKHYKNHRFFCWFLLLFDIELNAVCVFVSPCRNCDLCILISNCTTTAIISIYVVVVVFVFLTHDKIEYRFRCFCYVMLPSFFSYFLIFFISAIFSANLK